MAELEAACGRLAARRLTEAHQGALVAALDACRVAAGEGTEAYYAENAVFHAVIYRASGNGFLCEQALTLSRRLAPFRRIQLRVRHRLRQSLAEHEGVVAAIRGRGDRRRAAARPRPGPGRPLRRADPQLGGRQRRGVTLREVNPLTRRHFIGSGTTRGARR
jgi:DNA-binding GntR family transcriptional regulator